MLFEINAMWIPVIFTREIKRMIILGLLLLLRNVCCGDSSDSSRKSLANENYHYSRHEEPRYEADNAKLRSNFEAYEDKQTDEKDVNSNYDFYTPYKNYAEEKDSLSIGFKRPKEISENIRSFLRKKYLDKNWFKPSEEDEKWIQTDAHKKHEDKESEEKPRYGFQPDSDDVPTHKKSQSVSSLDEENRGHEPKGLKDNLSPSQWRPHHEKSDPPEYQNKNKKTIQEKQIDYESTSRMVYPNDERNSNSEPYKARENIPYLKSNSYYPTRALKPGYTEFSTDKWQGQHNENEGGSYGNSFYSDINKQLPINHEGRYLNPEFLKEHQFRQSHVIDGWVADKKQTSGFPDSESAIPGGKNFEEDSHGPHQHPKKYSHFIPELFHGGHSYGWTYRPDQDLHEKYEMDMKKKEHFLAEHERKLADLQKKHMESYEKFMGKPFEGGERGHRSHITPEVETNFNYNTVNEKGNIDKFSKSYEDTPPEFSENLHPPTW